MQNVKVIKSFQKVLKQRDDFKISLSYSVLCLPLIGDNTTAFLLV